ncbi:MAG: hypothetical protein HC835_17690 [Oscillatoriales cyanobacterium RM2_1_1]|nr:hypothetical protein [Oscillatoriales cyanobacterium RM2_1_1]
MVSPSTDTIQSIAGPVQERLIQTLADSAASEESLRIYLGRRIVFGELASGEQRRELSEDRAEMILAAIAEPSAPNISAALDKVPAIEIRQGDEIFFRQERDGGVSINAFQHEQVAEAAVPMELIPDPESPITDPWIGLDEVVDLDAISQVAQSLIDLFGEQAPLTEASLGDLDLRQEGRSLSLVQDETVLLTAINGHVEAPEQISSEAAETLQGWVKEHVWTWREVPIAAAIPENNLDLKPTVEEIPKVNTASPSREHPIQAGQSNETSIKSQLELSEPKAKQPLEAIQVV